MQAITEQQRLAELISACRRYGAAFYEVEGDTVLFGLDARHPRDYVRVAVLPDGTYACCEHPGYGTMPWRVTTFASPDHAVDYAASKEDRHEYMWPIIKHTMPMKLTDLGIM
jgi:hypothetical protein